MSETEAKYEVEIEDLRELPLDDVRYMGDKVAPVRIYRDRTSHPGYRLEISEFTFETRHFNVIWKAMQEAQKCVHENGGTANISVTTGLKGRSAARFLATFKERS